MVPYRNDRLRIPIRAGPHNTMHFRSKHNPENNLAEKKKKKNLGEWKEEGRLECFQAHVVDAQ